MGLPVRYMILYFWQVILENKGDIAGSYAMKPTQTLFGPKFTFVPNAGTLQPGGFQAIQVGVHVCVCMCVCMCVCVFVYMHYIVAMLG